MKSIIKAVVLLFSLVLFNCKKEAAPLALKYANMPEAIKCQTSNSKLYLEALYSFEKDILHFYGKNTRNPNALPNLTYAYSRFIQNAVNGRVHFESVVSPHSAAVFKALKNDNTLWDPENTKSHLNYNGPLITCIAQNIKNTNLKTTFNSLLTINDLSPKLFGPSLTSNYSNALSDKYLATYIAFDLYYSKLFEVNLNNVSPKVEEKTKVDFNRLPKKD